MGEKEGKETKKTSRKRGCMITALILIALCILVIWQIGEPSRRAKRVHQAIRPGMVISDIENLLEGRYYCFYQVRKDDGWQNVSREDFLLVLENQSIENPIDTRLQLIFMGMSPGRSSFFVRIDSNGTVSDTTDPHGWD